jgi:hypothetical protein
MTPERVDALLQRIELGLEFLVHAFLADDAGNGRRSSKAQPPGDEG